MTDFVTGDKALDRRLKEVATKIAEKAVSSGIRAGLGEIRKSIRGSVTNPRVRKTIASRFKRKKKYGTTEAKVGAGVGKHKGDSGPRGRSGVGISKQNAHWYFLGTGVRQTRAGASRGRMPPNHAVAIGYARSSGAALAKMQTKIRQVLDKEVNKLK